MDGLPELLALLYGAGERWSTVSAVGVRWHDHVVGVRALEQYNARLGSRTTSLMAFTSRDGEPPRYYESEERFWIDGPSRWRLEDAHGVSVGENRLWWRWSEEQGFVSNEEAPEVHYGTPLEDWSQNLDPGSLLSALRFESIDERDGLLRVRASPAERQHVDLHLPGRGADLVLLDVDPERGVVVRCEAQLDGEPFSRSELRDAVFDEPLADDLFVLEPPPGEPRQSPFGGAEHLTLAEAVERASFPVLAFRELPDGPWDLRVRYHAAHRAIAETVSLIYFRRDGRASVTAQEVTADAEEKLGSGGGALRLRHGDTAVLIRANGLDAAELRALTDTLEPV